MLTHARLTEVLDYDQETGHFTWKIQLAPRGPVGKIAGSKDVQGRVLIGIDGVLHLAHRLAWFYVNREWPEKIIDHRNNDAGENCFSNLRPANRSQNAMNSKCHRDSLTGIKGVSFDSARGKWIAQLSVRGKRVLMKRFPTADQAKRARDAAADLYHADFARSA